MLNRQSSEIQSTDLRCTIGKYIQKASEDENQHWHQSAVAKGSDCADDHKDDGQPCRISKLKRTIEVR